MTSPLRASLSVLSLLMACSPAKAESVADEAWHLVVHTRSWHASEPEGVDWVEANWGLGIRRQTSARWSWQAGVFRNSLGKPAGYALLDGTPWNVGPMSLGGSVGWVAGGYEVHHFPVAGLLARYQAGAFSVGLRAFPRPPKSLIPGYRSALTTVEIGWTLP